MISKFVLSLIGIALLVAAAETQADGLQTDRSSILATETPGVQDKGPVAHNSTSDYLVFWIAAGVTCGDNELLGCEYAGGHYYITGGNSGGEPNKVYLFDINGFYLDEFNQWSQPGWGWRDLVYDGVYLYGSDSDTIYAFDLDGNPVPSMNIIGPISPCRGLAYDARTDHFWTASWDSDLYEFDRSGTIHFSGPSHLSWVYGLAWDDLSFGSPWLWIFDQSGTPATTIFQYDPVNHSLTGYAYTVPLIPGCTDQVAGGLAFTDEIPSYGPSFVGLAQATPEDVLFVDQMYPSPPPNPEISLAPLGAPIIIPQSGGFFDYNIEIVNLTPIPQTFQAWIMVTLPDGTQLGPLLGPIDLHLSPGSVFERNRSQEVPARAPAGEYQNWGYIGVYPDSIWDSDSFPFTKLEEGGGQAYFQDWQNTGEDIHGCPVLTRRGGTEVFFNLTVMSTSPNPFNSSTTISFNLPSSGQASLKIYDITGRNVTTLLNRDLPSGSHSIQFDGRHLTSGVYLAVLESGAQRAVQRLLLLK